MKHWKFMFNDDCSNCLETQDRSHCPYHQICMFPWCSFFFFIVACIIKAIEYL